MTDQYLPDGALAGATVFRVGFGAMQLDAAERGDGTARDTAQAVLRRAVDLGVNHVDTAHFYGGGVVNGLIREALQPYPDDLVLVSKVGAVHDPDAGLLAAQQPSQLRAGVEADLRSLGVERLDVVNLRRLDSGAGIRAAGDQVVDLDDQLAEMVALRDEGKIGAIGLSNVDLGQLRRALPVDVACVQNRYNLLLREDEPMLRLCAQNGVAWVPFFPLGSAFDGAARVTDVPEVVDVARGLSATPAQVGLAWLLRHDPHVLLIPGTSSVAHLEQNVAAADIVLDAAATATLDSVAAAPDTATPPAR